MAMATSVPPEDEQLQSFSILGWWWMRDSNPYRCTSRPARAAFFQHCILP